MKRPNITPGEWHLGKRAGAEHGAIYGEKGEEVALPLGFFMEDAEAKANARAIASVPKLLEALGEVQNLSQHLADSMVSAGFHPDNTNRVLDLVHDALIEAGYTFD